MPDVALSVTVTRDLLGLSLLEIGRAMSYYATPTFLGGTKTWNRTQVGSPWLNGQKTTNRVLENVTETLAVVYRGQSPDEAQEALLAIVAAFEQDTFVMTIVANGVTNSYQCEAADSSILWDGPHLVSNQGQVTFSMPRQPVPLVGV